MMKFSLSIFWNRRARHPWPLPMILLILLAVHFPLSGNAKMAMPTVKISKAEGPVTIEADNLLFDREAQIYYAHGNVEVTRGNFSLKADHARLNKSTNDLMAWGNVLAKEGEDVIECERLEVNTETRLGKLYGAKLFLKAQNCHVAGREMEKLGEKRYRVQDASFTTCNAALPPWKFAAEELEVTVHGQGIAKDPVFYVEDIPVLYFPWAVIPLDKERQTGFLLPKVGYSSRYGMEAKGGFYWEMSRDMDATGYLDYLGNRGLKEGLEYRYTPSPDITGKANFYFIDDQKEDKNRYAFFARHLQKLPSDFYLKANINYAGDNNYPRDFYEDLPEGARIDSRSAQQLRSALYGGKNWDQFSLLGQGLYFRDLTTTEHDETLQKLPQLSFFAHPQSLFRSPFFYDVSSTYTNFWREKGIEAHRWDLLPHLSYPARVFDVFKVESNLGLRETLYQPDHGPTDDFNRFKSREIVTGDVEASTELYRVYEAKQGSWISSLFKVSKWMHMIEPTVGYQYIPPVHQDDLPQFDDVDRIPFTSQISYGVTQRLLGKAVGSETGAFEYARLTVSQNYSLGSPFSRDQNGKARDFSNIQFELWWNFNPYVYAKGDAELNPYTGSLDIWNTLINLKDKRNDTFQIEYRYTKDNVRSLNLDGRVKVINPLYLYSGIRYNLLENTRVETIYGIDYQDQCWRLGLTMYDINGSPDGTQKREFKFEVYFELLGVSSVGHKPGFMGL